MSESRVVVSKEVPLTESVDKISARISQVDKPKKPKSTGGN